MSRCDENEPAKEYDLDNSKRVSREAVGRVSAQTQRPLSNESVTGARTLNRGTKATVTPKIDSNQPTERGMHRSSKDTDDRTYDIHV